jgi:hypothetical protein
MAAGTVISGGFPGRVAQEVQPNPKCHGCLHFDGQAGRTGACLIGLRPWLCGDGEAQDIGYAPIDKGAGSYLPDMVNHGAHAPEAETQFVSDLYGSGSTRPVSIEQVSLGEEHVHVVKSMYERHVQMEKSTCRLCQHQGAIGTAPSNFALGVCTCQPIAARDIAKALVPRLSNAHRRDLTLDDLTEWVRDVAKAGFKVPKKARSLGSKVAGTDRHAEGKKATHPARLSPQLRVVKGDDYNGGHLTRIVDEPDVVKSSPVEAQALDKSYNDDWLCQFKGTPLFKLAHQLCEQELEMQEAQLKRRLESRKHEKERSAALAKLEKPDNGYDWQEADAIRERLSIAKQRLTLKLAEHQQKAIAKSDRDDFSKAIDNTKHSHIVTGKLAPQGRGFSSVQRARNARDKLDMQHGSYAHHVGPNPNFKPSKPVSAKREFGENEHGELS